MDKLLVHGNSTLQGSINISGSKNASLPILAATLLSDQASIIRRVPDVSDTNYMLQILRALGAEVERSSGTVRVEPSTISPEAPYDLVRKMRASICVMGPLLARVEPQRTRVRPLRVHPQAQFARLIFVVRVLALFHLQFAEHPQRQPGRRICEGGVADARLVALRCGPLDALGQLQPFGSRRAGLC